MSAASGLLATIGPTKDKIVQIWSGTAKCTLSPVEDVENDDAPCKRSNTGGRRAGDSRRLAGQKGDVLLWRFRQVSINDILAFIIAPLREG
jgi:hypothetical protein